MKALIGSDLVRKLPDRDVEIRDTKLTGFLIRCRASGVHVYRYMVGRGVVVTLGRVDKMPVTEARAAAEARQNALSRETVALLAEETALTARDAKARVRQANRRNRRGTRYLWKDFVDEYERLATGDMKTARENLRRLRRAFGPWFNDTRIDAISTFEIERWRVERRKQKVNGLKKIAASTINRDLDALRAALGWAVRAGMLGSNPAAGIRRAKTDRNVPIRFLSVEDETNLRAALTARDDRRKLERASFIAWQRERGYDEVPPYGAYPDHLTPITLLALNTGARRGELFNLRWADVDEGRNLMILRGGGTKNAQTRIVPLNAEAVEVLKAWRPVEAKTLEHVFPGQDGERLVSLKTAWVRVVREAGLPRARFHDLRHTFASRLVQRSVDLAVIKELMGHSTIAITERYAKLDLSQRAAAVARLVNS